MAKIKKPIFALPKKWVQSRVSCLKSMTRVVGLVVQLVRMPPCHGGGRGFESRPVRRKEKARRFAGFFFSE